MYLDDGDYLQLKNEIMLGYTGIGDLRFLPEFRYFFHFQGGKYCTFFSK